MCPGHPPGMPGWGEDDPGWGKDVFGVAESHALELRWSASEALNEGRFGPHRDDLDPVGTPK